MLDKWNQAVLNFCEWFLYLEFYLCYYTYQSFFPFLILSNVPRHVVCTPVCLAIHLLQDLGAGFGWHKRGSCEHCVKVSAWAGIPFSGINAQEWALAIFDSCTFCKTLICCAHWKSRPVTHEPIKGKNRKSYPQLNVYFYINIVLNIETSQHLCGSQHMPGCISGLLCLLTHLSSQQPSRVCTAILPTYIRGVRHKVHRELGEMIPSVVVGQSGLRSPRFNHHPMTWPSFTDLSGRPSGLVGMATLIGWVNIHQSGCGG